MLSLISLIATSDLLRLPDPSVGVIALRQYIDDVARESLGDDTDAMVMVRLGPHRT